MIKAEDKLAFWSLGIMIFIVLTKAAILKANNISSVIAAIIVLFSVIYYCLVYPLLKFWERWKQEK